jgi:hypothetical protein
MNGIRAYSRLATILSSRNIAVPELRRQLSKLGVPVNIKSLYRLASPEPIQKIDLRIVGAICRTYHVGIQEVIDFAKPKLTLQRLDAPEQKRLDELMSKNNEGELTTTELHEFEELAGKAHQLTLANARLLASQRRMGAAGARRRARRNRPTRHIHSGKLRRAA